MSFSMSFEDVYILSSGTVVGPKEKKGPYGHYFDTSVKNCYATKKSFEDGEIAMVKDAIQIALKKSKLQLEQIPMLFGGDLTNQIAISSMVSQDLPGAFIGVYAACATSTLTLGLAATYIHLGLIPYALAYTSSNYAVAERQFRYPNDYGIQKKESTTTTITGAASFVLSNQKSPIQVTEMTYGSVYNSKLSDLNDMGSPMAYAAYHTICDHLQNFHRKVEDYDLILTGDLSKIGSNVLRDCFRADGIELYQHKDAGSIIYHREEEKVYAGGSGPACIAVIAGSVVLKEMQEGKYQRVLLVATGALFSPTLSQQKHDIPVIAHALTLEVRK